MEGGNFHPPKRVNTMRIIIDVPDDGYLNLEQKCHEIKSICDDISVETVLKIKLSKLFSCCECDINVTLTKSDLLLVLEKLDKCQINPIKTT